MSIFASVVAGQKHAARLARRRAIRQRLVTPRKWVRKSPFKSPARDPKDLFFAHVRRTKTCWLWTGTKDKDGYGKFQISIPGENRQKTIRAHVFSWFVATGNWPTQQVLHKCNTRCCVKPTHLKEGTQAENIQQCVLEGRHPKQCRNLTPQQVRKIRIELKQGICAIDISRKLEVPPSIVYALKAGRTWSWLQ